MPGWPSRLLPNNAGGAPSSRRAHSPDSLYDGDFDLPDIPPSLQNTSRRPSAPLQDRYASSPPRAISSGPRPRPHMHTGSDKISGGSRPRRPGPNGIEASSYPSTSDTSLHERGPSRTKSGKGPVDDRNMDAGNCATCDTRVRWPKGVNEFRCSTCLMVNDFRPVQSRSRSPRDGAPVSTQSSGQTTANAPPPNQGQSDALMIKACTDDLSPPGPLSVERTMSIMNRCIDTYVEAYKQGHVPRKTTFMKTPPDSPTQFPLSVDKTSPASPGPQAFLDRARDLPTTPPDDSMFPNTFIHDLSNSPDRTPHSRSGRRPSNALDLKNGGTPNMGAIARKPVGGGSQNLPPRPARKPPPIPVMVDGEQRQTTDGDVRDNAPSFEPRSRPLLPPSRIFRPLEDYVIRSYGDQQCLSTSFMTTRARPRVTSNADGGRPRTARSPPKRTPAQTLAPPRDPAIHDSNLSEIDAKTLLLGDVAANGLWWTGMEERAPLGHRRKSDRGHDASKGLVNLKSPHINWFELDNWYDTLIRAGCGWRQRLKDEDLRGLDTEEIDRQLSEGRAHLHQTLLKCTEALLKRPGRPLKEPQDARFLLLLLANPMIHPTKPSAYAGMGPNAFEAGHAYGIIKRILGILANLSNDCHRHLVAWLSRYDEPHFRTIVEVLERFVTHRLKLSHGRKKSNIINPTAGLIPNLSGTSADTSATLHAALGFGGPSKGASDKSTQNAPYTEDWQVRAAARFMSLLFSANKNFVGERMASTLAEDARMSRPGSISRTHIKIRGQLLSTSDFYNTMVDTMDLIADFDTWESSKTKFSFCQYPFFLSVGAKIRIMEHDAKRQMESRAREAFFDSLLKNKALEQHLILKVRRECLVEDSLTSISEVVGTGQEDIKKSLKVQFANEEGIDAGGLRKEWFMLLAREIFDPNYGLFLYDEESRFCWFNPQSFESSDRFFLVGALLGLAIYHTTIIDVPLPPFTFKKLLASSPPPSKGSSKPFIHRPPLHYTLDDLAELRPSLAKGLKQLLEFDGDVESTFCLDFVAEVASYGTVTEVPLCDNGRARPVTNANRAEFVDTYIRFLLDGQISRQFEPFKRGFFTVCGGNALALFQPEEIELLVRGSDEGLDVGTLRATASYQNWKIRDRPVKNPDGEVPLISWFWELLEEAGPRDQRNLLSFITGSDRMPAVGANALVITLTCAGAERERFPIARTCFNVLMLYQYRSKRELSERLWKAVGMSEGFGLR
ncbi:MAG: hypothetical protein Q9159_004077 [Coniocarpon cinnabarinum]